MAVAVVAVLASVGFGGLTTVTTGCGGTGEVTTAPDPRIECPSLDEQLGGLYALVEAGELDALADSLGSLHQDLQGDLVLTLLRLVGEFEPGTFAGLVDLTVAAGDSGALTGTLADVVDFIATAGPGAPYKAAMTTTGVLLKTCDGPQSLGLVKNLLGDTQLLDALGAVLAEFDLASQIEQLEVDGNEGREAIKALARNLLVAAQRPDFDVEVLIDLLALVVDVDVAPFQGLATAMRTLLGPGPNLEGLQSLLGCVQAADPELRLVEMLLDVVVDETLNLFGALSSGGGGVPTELIPASLSGPLNAVLDFLITDSSARRVLADVVVATVTASNVAAVLGDIATLLRADLLGDLVGTLSNLATRSCPERRNAQ